MSSTRALSLPVRSLVTTSARVSTIQCCPISSVLAFSAVSCSAHSAGHVGYAIKRPEKRLFVVASQLDTALFLYYEKTFYTFRFLTSDFLVLPVVLLRSFSLFDYAIFARPAHFLLADRSSVQELLNTTDRLEHVLLVDIYTEQQSGPDIRNPYLKTVHSTPFSWADSIEASMTYKP